MVLGAGAAFRRFRGPDAYRLGEGDEITVDVWGRPELSGKHVVGPDGRITLPVAGTLLVRNLSRDEAVDAIRKALAPFYVEPAVTLRVDRYTSNRVFVLGRVANPGALQFDSTPTLLDVITRAGALPVGGAGAEKATLNRCAVVRGDRIVWIDLKTLLTETNLAYNIRLRRNDLVYIPDSDDELVYVLGEVEHPGAIRLTPQMTMMDAFAQAGGPTKDAAITKIQLVRPVAGEHRVVTIKEILKPQPEVNVGLQQGDIIYVPRRGLATFGYWMDKVNPIATFGIFGAAVAK
jgi:polysaccharide export outer membrane protein